MARWEGLFGASVGCVFEERAGSYVVSVNGDSS